MENTQQPISAQPSPAQPVKPVDMGKQSQPKKSNFLTILLSILLLVSLSVAGYFAYQVQNLTKQVNELKSKPNPTAISNPTQTPVSVEDPTVDWKIYNNSIFSFKYPTDLDLSTEEGNRVLISKWGPTQQEGQEFHDGISLYFDPRELGISAKDYLQTKIDEIENAGVSTIEKKLSEVTVGQYKGYSFVSSGLTTTETIAVESNSGIIVVITNATSDPGNVGFAPVADQILSTFEFTN